MEFFAKNSISFFPLPRGEKAPSMKWTVYQKRLPDSSEITSWSKTEANLAIVTGKISNIVVVDIDSTDAKIWAEKNLPITPMKTRTAKGEHWFYRYPGVKIGNKVKSGPHNLEIDIRGDGGYVVAPYSTHPDGYIYSEISPWTEIQIEQIPVFDPAWFLVKAAQAKPISNERPLLNRKILNDLIKKGQAVEGQGGDKHTFETACYLTRDLGLSINEAMIYFQEWNKSNAPPWGDEELRKKLLGAIEYGTGTISKPQRLILTSAKDFLAEPPENFNWIWQERLISIGTSIVVSKPKIGKTTFARNLAAAISMGQDFLGLKTKKSVVVYIAAEENREQFKKSLSHFDPETIQDLYIHTGHTPPNLIECLEQYMEEMKPSLIILDTMIRAINVADTNSYAEMTKALAPFQEFATKYQCHVMFIHHAGKMEREHGDGVLGSTAIFGSVDSLIMLEKRKDHIYLKTIQRYGQSLEPHVLYYNKETRSHSIGESSNEIQNATHEEKVLTFLRSVTAATEGEIHKNVEGHKSIVGATIRRLVSERKLTREGNGKRNDPYLYSLPF